MDKILLRKEMKKKKKNLAQMQMSAAGYEAAARILQLDAYCNADCLYTYMAYNNEVPTLPIVEQALLLGKRVAVPKLYGNEMHFLYIDSFDQLVPDRFGIPTPIYDTPIATDPGIMLVPGLAFGRDGSRVGYGGGYYDRYLSTNSMEYIIGLCYDFQLFETVPTQPHDQKMDMVLDVSSKI